MSLANRMHDGVLTITLDRPDVRNAMDTATLRGLARALTAAAEDAEVGAVALAGGGGVFSAGVDVQDMALDPWATAEAFLDLLQCAAAFPKPLAAAVEGCAVGGGWLLAACADLVFATADSGFVLPEVRLGAPPFVALPLLARWLPAPALGRVVYDGETMSAAELARFAALQLADAPLAAAETALRARAQASRLVLTRLKTFERAELMTRLTEARAMSLAFLRARSGA